jgi:hypothetical protein
MTFNEQSVKQFIIVEGNSAFVLLSDVVSFFKALAVH